MLISIDIGGSGIRAQCINPEGRLINKLDLKFDIEDSKVHYKNTFQILEKKLLEFEGYDADICIAYPGPCNHNRIPFVLPTLFGFDGTAAFNFCTELENILLRTFNTANIIRVNDVEAAGYSVNKNTNFHIIMLGSGIGWKTFHKGEPLISNSIFAGEICNTRLNYIHNNCKSKEHLSGTLNLYYQNLLKKKTYTDIGEMIGNLIGINMLTSGISDTFIGGGIVYDPHVFSEIQRSANTMIEKMLPFDSVMLANCIFKINERYPALDGGIILLSRRAHNCS